MKTNQIIILAVVMTFAFQLEGFAQRGGAGNQSQNCNLPDISLEQQEKISVLRTAQIERTNQHRARMNELRARKQSFRIEETPDMSEINRLIDQMQKLRSDHMKANAAHHQSIREVLTPEQRAVFDSRTSYQRQGQRLGRQFQNPHQDARRQGTRFHNRNY